MAVDLSKLGKKDHQPGKEEKFKEWIMGQMDQMFGFMQGRANNLESRVNSNNINLVALCRLTGITPEQLMSTAREREATEAFIDECIKLEEKFKEEAAKEAGAKLEEKAEELLLQDISNANPPINNQADMRGISEGHNPGIVKKFPREKKEVGDVGAIPDILAAGGNGIGNPGPGILASPEMGDSPATAGQITVDPGLKGFEVGKEAGSGGGNEDTAPVGGGTPGERGEVLENDKLESEV